MDGLKRFDKEKDESISENENDNIEDKEDENEEESVVRTERTNILESFKDKLTEFLDNAE